MLYYINDMILEYENLLNKYTKQRFNPKAFRILFGYTFTNVLKLPNSIATRIIKLTRT